MQRCRNPSSLHVHKWMGDQKKKKEEKIWKGTCHFYRFPGLRERRPANLWEVMDVSRVAKSYVWEAERQLTQTQCHCEDKKRDKHQKKKKKDNKKKIKHAVQEQQRGTSLSNLEVQEWEGKKITVNCLFSCTLFFIITYLASLSGCIMEMK